MEKNLHISALLDVYGAFLGEKQRKLTAYYYNDDLSLSEISQNEGITRQGARDCIKRAENTLYDIENRLKLIERFENIRKKLEEIEYQANSILDIIPDTPDNSEALKRAEYIIEISNQIKSGL